MNQIHIFIPKLLSPLKLWNKDFGFQVKSPVLSELLSSSIKKKNSHDQGLTTSLFTKLGHPKDSELPIAYYRYQLDFGSPPDTQIMCADPINLQAGIDEIILNPEPINDLSKTDAEELISALNKHFAQDGWEFISADSGNCYLKHQSNEAISTTPLDYAKGKSIFQHLPQSETLNWHSLQNEMQMLLHMTSLNQTREMAGQLPINSLWLWGAGKTSNLSHQFDTILGGTESKAAALAAKITHNTLKMPIQTPHTGRHIIVLNELYDYAVLDQYTHWQDALHRLEEEYISPISTRCKQKKIELFINTCDGNEFQIKPKKSWAFWKKTSTDLLDISPK